MGHCRNARCFPACRQLGDRRASSRQERKKPLDDCSYMGSEILGSLCHSLGCHASSSSTGGWDLCSQDVFLQSLCIYLVDFFRTIFNRFFSECSLRAFFLVRDLSKAGAEWKYHQVGISTTCRGFVAAPCPPGPSTYTHTLTKPRKAKVFSSHSALRAQHPGCYLCVTTKALLVTCLCPCLEAIRRTLGGTCPTVAGGSARDSDNFILLYNRERTSSSNIPHFQASPC